MEFFESFKVVNSVLPLHSVLLAALLIGLKLLWYWAMLDCAFGKRVSGGGRLRWLLIVGFLGILGGLIYFFKFKARAAEPAPAEAV